MGYEHREDEVEVGGAGNGKHTHTLTHSVPRDTQGGWSLVQGWDAILTHVSVAPPPIKLMGYGHREDAVTSGGSRQWQTHTHTHSVPRYTQDGWSLRQRSDAILTHERVARPLIKLLGYEQCEYTVGVRGQAMSNTLTHKHTQSVPEDG